MFTKSFWKAASERAIRAGSNVALFALGTTAFTKVGEFVDVGESVAVGFAFGAAVSYLTSLTAGAIGADKGTPAFTSTETLAD